MRLHLKLIKNHQTSVCYKYHRFIISDVESTLVKQLKWISKDGLTLSVRNGMLILEKAIQKHALKIYHMRSGKTTFRYDIFVLPRLVVESLGWKHRDRLFGIVHDNKLIIEKSRDLKTRYGTSTPYNLQKQERFKDMVSKSMEFSEINKQPKYGVVNNG